MAAALRCSGRRLHCVPQHYKSSAQAEAERVWGDWLPIRAKRRKKRLTTWWVSACAHVLLSVCKLLMAGCVGRRPADGGLAVPQ